MRRSLLAWYARCLVGHPLWILLPGILLTVIAVLLALQLELHTSRENLSDSFHQAETAFDEFVEELGSPHHLVVVVEPRPDHPEVDSFVYREFVDDLAQRLASRPAFFTEVLHRVDLARFVELGLYYAERDALQQAEDALLGPQAMLPEGGTLHGLADANRRLARRLATEVKQGPGGVDSEASLEPILRALRWQVRFLADPEAALAELPGDDPAAAMGTSGPELSPEGYLISRDGRHYFLLAQPTRTTSSLDFIRPLVAHARAAIAATEELHPALQAGVTGTPALIEEEMAAIRRDSFVTTALAAVGVILLSLWAFHRIRLAPLVLLSLAMGVSWSAGAVYLAIGYLSLITSAFAVILIGLGIDYGVHLVSQYEIELAEGEALPEALRNALSKTGPGLLTGAGTTAVAFFTITLMEFRGFAQLGLVAGIGVVLCLLAMLTVLPALLSLDGARKFRQGRPRHHRLQRGHRITSAILRYPAAVVGVCLVLTVVLAWKAREVRYNENLEDLLPAGAESLRLQDALRDSSELSPDFAVILAEDLEELERLQNAEPYAATIGRRESLLDYLPTDAGEREAVLERLRPAIERIQVASEPRGHATDLDAALADLEDSFAEVEEIAFSSGRTELLEESGEALDLLAEARRSLSGPDAAAAAARGEARLLDWGREWLGRLGEMAAQAPPSLEDLPPALRSRLVGRSGRYPLYLYPAGDLSRPDALRQFVEDCRRMSPAVTGPPVLLHEHSSLIRGGYDQALVLASVLAIAILLLDFRRPGYALLAALPTAVGLVWMLGWMTLAGLDFNLANLIAVPLILGVGVDNGAHMMHRFVQEGKEGMAVVLHHTGRAIFISSLTTMIGFGSLALASHRGMASMGLILFSGVASCLVTSTLLLPCLLRLLRARGRR
jgi:hopanoid biosynthesis associated RND transporter like protein HpnN